MKLIGLTGAAGSGKSTVADFLTETQGFVSISLADPLRAGLKAMLGLTEAELHDRSMKESPIDWLGRSPRELMQTLGTEWGRQHVAPDLWLRVATRRITVLRASSPCLHVDGIVVSDVRFGNEAQWLRDQGGELWQLARDEAGLEGATAKHPSERGVLGDVVIFNNSTLDDLFDLVVERLARTPA